jgi:hypothetical protein
VYRQDSTWNRQELYEKVWQFSLRTLAEYGISDVGLAKVCRNVLIPLPGTSPRRATFNQMSLTS